MIKTMRDDLMKEALIFYQFAPTSAWVVKETSKKMEKVYLNCISCGNSRFSSKTVAKSIGSDESAQFCQVCSYGFLDLWEKVERLPDPKKFWDEYNRKTYSFNYLTK